MYVCKKKMSWIELKMPRFGPRDPKCSDLKYIESIHVAGDLETVYMQIKNHLDCMSTLCTQGNNFMKEQRN